MILDTRVWHAGPPPHVGWWNAAHERDAESWMYWDTYWSMASDSGDSPEQAAINAQWPSSGDHIEWTHYYPSGEHRHRINPNEVNHG